MSHFINYNLQYRTSSSVEHATNGPIFNIYVNKNILAISQNAKSYSMEHSNICSCQPWMVASHYRFRVFAEILANIQDRILSLFKVEVIGRGLIYIYISVTQPDSFEYIFFY